MPLELPEGLQLPLPPSELQKAIDARCFEIEEREIPLLVRLEEDDQPVWIRFQSDPDNRVTGVTILETPPADHDAEGYDRHSRLYLWQMMNSASCTIVDSILRCLAIPQSEGRDGEWHSRWAPLLASGGHGFGLFELGFGRDFLPKLDEMYRRSFALAALALFKNVGPRTSSFLRRLPAAYVFGLDAEVIILCRAVVEAALKEKAGVDGRPTLGALLKKAELEQWLPPDELATARDLISRANALVHEDVPQLPDSLTAIKDAMTIVSWLVGDEPETETDVFGASPDNGGTSS